MIVPDARGGVAAGEGNGTRSDIGGLEGGLWVETAEYCDLLSGCG